MTKTAHSRTFLAWLVAGLLIAASLAAGFVLVLMGNGAGTVHDLGLAIISGAVIGAVFVTVEYLLTRAEDDRSRLRQVLDQLHSTTELSGIDLEEMDLRGAYLPNKNLALAKMDRVLLDDATMLFGNFSFASLAGMSGRGADFGGSDLKDCTLEAAQLSEADFYDSDLRRANLRGAVMRGTRLTNADLTDADLRDADLTDSVLQKAQLHSARLDGALLAGADLTAIDYDEATVWPDGFSPPPPTPRERDWVSGTTPVDWLLKRRQDPRLKSD